MESILNSITEYASLVYEFLSDKLNECLLSKLESGELGTMQLLVSTFGVLIVGYV